MPRTLVTLSVQIALAALLLAPPAPVLAQERFGAVAGTWEACAQKAQTLREKLETAQQEAETPETWLRYLKHRLAVQLDRCTQTSEAPLAAILDLAARYEELGLEDRSLSIALDANERLGNIAELHLVAGRLLYRKGVMRAAVHHLEEVVAQRPTDAVANQLLGAYFYDRGEFEQALGYLRTAARIRSDQFEANAAVGDACLAVGDLGCAGDYLGRAVRLKPNDALLAVKVGDLHRANGEYGLAIEAYEIALNAEPDRLDARLGLGRTAALAGLTEVAQAWFVDASNRAPKNLTAAIEASRALRIVGRPDPSRLPPAFGGPIGPVEGHVEYVLAMLASGTVSKAQTHVDSVASKFDNDDRFMAVSGDVLLASDAIGEALLRYRRARESRPDAEPYLVREARALRQLGQASEAAALLEPRLQDAGEAVQAEFLSATLDLIRRDAETLEMPNASRMLAAASAVAATDRDVLLARAVEAGTHGDEAKALEILATVPESGERTAVEAWVAYSSKRYRDAAQLAAAAHQTIGDPDLVLLQGAALVKMGQNHEALQVLGKTSTDSPDSLLTQWRAQALSSAAYATIAAGKYDDSAALVLDKAFAGINPGYAKWLARVPLLAQAAHGKISAEAPSFVAFQAAIKADKKREPIDLVLLALKDLAAGAPQSSLKLLRSLSSEQATQVAERAHVELASQLFAKGRGREARREVDAIAKPESMPQEARLNLVVMKHANNPQQLAQALTPFADAMIPAALLDLAMVLEKVKKDGSAAIDPLTKLMTLSAPRLVRDNAEALLALKKRLY